MTRDSESLPSSGANENTPEEKPKKKSFVRITPSRKTQGSKSARDSATKDAPKSEVLEAEVLDSDAHTKPKRSTEARNSGERRSSNRRADVIDVSDLNTENDSESDSSLSQFDRDFAPDPFSSEFDPDSADQRPVPSSAHNNSLDAGFEPYEEITPDFDESALNKEKGIVVSNALQRYLSELRKFSLMSIEEERAAATEAYEHNDVKARNRLVTANLRLVVKIAMEYRRNYSQILDLIQEGNAGLVQAVNRFNPYRGVKLSTYSAWWIRAYILKFLMDNKSLVRMGTTDAQRKLFFRLRSEAEKMYALTQRFDANLLAESIGVKPSDVIEMQQRLTKNDVSLDAPVRDDSDTRQIDNLAAEIEEPDVAIEREQVLSLLRNEVGEVEKELNDRDKFIFQNRIMAEDPITLQDVGDKFGITRERARQLESRVLKKIKERLVAAGIQK